jgi:hypothetical protein
MKAFLKYITATLIIATFSILLFNNCSRVPITNRKQILLLPESELVSMGITNYRGFLDTVKLS